MEKLHDSLYGNFIVTVVALRRKELDALQMSLKYKHC